MATEKPDYLEHRKRLRARFETAGSDGLLDYELLELCLFNSLPRVDTKPIAKALIKKFGSFAEVLAAPREQLIDVKGVGPTTATYLKVIQAAASRMGKENLLEQPILSSWSALMTYCRAEMQFEAKEQFRVLFLDKKNRLIEDEIMGRGTVDRAPVYPREVIKRALDLSATALILAHNHPSGDPTPSQSDIDMTHKIIDAGKTMGIVVHDHIIIGRNDIVSFKTLGLM